MLRDGQVWGEDVLLDNPPLQLDLPAIASTYLGVFIMNGKMFISALSKFPGGWKRNHVPKQHCFAPESLVALASDGAP